MIRYDKSALPPQSCPSGQDDQAVVRKSGSLHALSRRGQSSSKCVSAMGVFVRKVHAKQVGDTMKNDKVDKVDLNGIRKDQRSIENIETR